MDLERFRRIVDAYGAAPERWPSDERDAAQAFLARSRDAALIVATARSLDVLMDGVPTLPPSQDLRACVLASAVDRLAQGAPAATRRKWTNSVGWRLAAWAASVGRDVDGIDWRSTSWRRPLAALGGAAVLGLALGVATPSAVNLALGDEDDLMAITVATPFSDVDEVVVEGEQG